MYHYLHRGFFPAHVMGMDVPQYILACTSIPCPSTRRPGQAWAGLGWVDVRRQPAPGAGWSTRRRRPDSIAPSPARLANSALPRDICCRSLRRPPSYHRRPLELSTLMRPIRPFERSSRHAQSRQPTWRLPKRLVSYMYVQLYVCLYYYVYSQPLAI